MADTAYTQSGNKFYISTTIEDDDLTDHVGSGFPSLSWVEVGNVGQLPEVGNDQNLPSYNVLSRGVSLKGKGVADAGAGTLEVARNDVDPGQIAMGAAAALSNYGNYAFKIERQDGSIDYLRGLVTGPMRSGGGNDDFDLLTYNISLNQEVLHVPAP